MVITRATTERRHHAAAPGAAFGRADRGRDGRAGSCGHGLVGPGGTPAGTPAEVTRKINADVVAIFAGVRPSAGRGRGGWPWPSG